MVRSFGQCLWFFFFIIIWLLPERIDNNVTLKQKSSQSYQKLNGLYKPIALNQKMAAPAIDTDQLKKSGWYAEALTSIEKSEYEIKPVGQSNTYSAPNRKQNLRAFYSPDKLKLQPRKDSSDQWDLELSTLGVFSKEQLLYAPDEHPQIQQKANSIQFIHQNKFITEYINNEQGIRQNFIIQKEPATNANTISVKLQVNKGWFVNKVHDKEIQFAKEEEGGLKKKLTYNQLKVWDARHKELETAFEVTDNNISIVVNTNGAVYPITIDPLSTTAAAMVESNQTTALMGSAVASAGDVNGDGYSDVIVGSIFYDNGQTDEGAAFVYHGSSTGVSTTPSAMLESNQTTALMGKSVASAGDVNGDGYSDVIVGAYLYDNGQTDEGAAFIYHGSATGLSSTPAIILESNQAVAYLGWSVASAGDVNGDGYSDVIVGSLLYDNGQTNEGAVFVYHGSATGINTTPAAIVESNLAGAQIGASVASAGDVNGDGYSDIIAGANLYANGQTDEGAAFICHGSATGISTTPAAIVESNQATAFMGISVASAGDVNGDGYSDVIVGAFYFDKGQTDEGAAFIYQGSATGISTTPAAIVESNQTDAHLGISVASAGDVNGDGYSDVIVGANLYDNGQTDEGAAFFYYGSITGINTTPAAMVESNQASAFMGNSVASAGDVNGDGYSDVIVGAQNYDNGQTDEGAAFIYHGAPDGLSTTPLLIDNITQSQAAFANAVSCAGDVNGDGYSDVIIGAPLYDDSGADEGLAFVYYGSSAGLPITANVILNEANQAGAIFGFSVAGAGDLNGDGFSDVIVGAFQYNGIGRVYVYFGSAAGLSTLSNQVLNGTQGGESFGVSISGAGDVNHDGYSDIVVGAYTYDVAGRTDEGRAYVYHGSSTGINVVPARILNDAGQPAAYFGRWVSSAGDVNGDGFADIMIGAVAWDDGANVDEGAAFVYYGTCSGVSATVDRILKDANQAGARNGYVATAGDLNGDGFSDVAVGAIFYDNEKGRVLVYYGSSTGLSVAPVILDNTVAGNTIGDRMGYSVASAGDVNGDGYSDLLVGVPQWELPGNNNQGRVFLYYGRPAGINTVPDKVLADNPNNLQFYGVAVAGAGDINGDGFSDVIIGGDHGSWPGFGIAYVYYGNNKGGLRNNMRLYNSNLSTPMTQSNITDPTQFGAGLRARSFLGKQKGKIVWQTIKNANAFTGSPITNSTQYTAQQGSYTDLGLNGVELKAAITKTAAPGNTYTRARVKYNLVTAITGQVYGPWKYPEGYLRGKISIADLAMANATVRLGNDTSVCFAVPYIINAAITGATGYTWQNGATTPTFSAVAPGLYWVDIVIGGCTFRDTIVLSAVTPTTGNLSAKVCSGQTYTAPSGNTYTASGIFKDTIKTYQGCDSIINTINLTVQTVTTQTTNPKVCAGQTYTLPWGTVVSSAGTYRDTLRYTITNCDSVYRIVNVTVQTTATQNTNAKFCAGQTFTLPWGTVVSTAGTYRDTLRYTITNCDSVYRIVNLTAQTATTQTINPKICDGQTYTLPWGVVVALGGTYRDTLRYTITNCDSVYRIVNLTIQTVTTQTTNPKICSGQTYTLPWGTIVSTAGTYRDTLRYTITNCDSVYRIVNLTVQTTTTQTINPKICAGQTYTLPWGTVVSTTGTYRDTLRYTITNCDSVYRIVNLIVQTATTQTTNPKICSGQSYTLPWGTIVSTAGTYRDTLRYTITNCDSVYRIVNLIVQTATTQTTNQTICAGQTYTLPWGTIVSTAGTYRDTLRYTITNCDSVYRIVNLTVQTATTQTTNPKICAGQTYTLPWGTIVSTAGTYRDTLRYTITNCDSVYRIVNLTVQTATTQTTNPKICPGQTYTLPWGTIVSTAGTYRDTLRYTITNCDSVYRIVNLTIQTATSQTLNPKVCNGQSYTLPWGTVVSTAGTYRDTLRYTITNCDSVYRIVNLTVQTTTTQTTNPKICAGQTYTLPWGTVVSTTGTYRDTLRYVVTNCDSVYRIVNLTVQTATTQTTNPKICPGQTYTLPWGTLVSTGGTYRDTLRYAITNCDSIYRIVNLTVQTATTQTTNPKICSGQTYTLPWGTVVSVTGTYRDTLRYTITNCDSVYRIVNLTVQTSTTQTINPKICAGQTYTLPWGTVVSTTGIYRDTLRYVVTNCDSVYRIVNLTVQTATTQTTNPKICAGQTYTLPWGTVVSATGTYRDTLRYTITNCDSVYRIVNLTVQTATTQTTNPKICAGQTYTLPWGVVVSVNGTYRDTLRYTVTNCDSVYRIVNLIIQTVQTQPTINAVICNGSSYTLPWGIVVNTSGLYKDTLKYTATGCDSVRRAVNVTVLSASTVTVNAGICQGQSYQMPSGILVNVSGVYKDTLKYKNYNCDSLYTTVNLTVTPAQARSTGIAICAGDTYVLPWGSVVTVSGIYKDTLRTAAGCDSLIRIINLSVLPKPIVRVTKSNDINCVIASSKLSASGGNRYLWSPAATLSNANSYNPVAFPSVTTVYSVKVTASNGCEAVDSITVVVNTNQSPDAFPVPNAFSPNNDGLNDCFGVQHWGAVTNFRFQIFNRWGELVFNTTNINECWNGTYKGLQQDPGGFVYRIAAETICGKIQREGIVYIMR